MGNTGIPVADSFRYLAKLIQYCKVKKKKKNVKSESEVSQLYPILSNRMDCSLPGSSLHGIFQAGVLEWGAIAFSVALSSAAEQCDPVIHIKLYFFLFFFMWFITEY